MKKSAYIYMDDISVVLLNQYFGPHYQYETYFWQIYFSLRPQSINSCGENEVFPFANDNAGTIRMRSNSHVQAMLDSSNDNSAATTPASDDNMGTTSTSHHQK